MHDEIFGVMIARGDLAVEIGFERLSEIQEEILWISEAAHVPVIWATQVLETLNKSGLATRAEVTDASFASRAECVMLNKGTYVLDVLKSLKDILKRSAGHHSKKRYTFRPMQIARNFFSSL
jgi:pyruvate kinase